MLTTRHEPAPPRSNVRGTHSRRRGRERPCPVCVHFAVGTVFPFNFTDLPGPSSSIADPPIPRVGVCHTHHRSLQTRTSDSTPIAAPVRDFVLPDCIRSADGVPCSPAMRRIGDPTVPAVTSTADTTLRKCDVTTSWRPRARSSPVWYRVHHRPVGLTIPSSSFLRLHRRPQFRPSG